MLRKNVLSARISGLDNFENVRLLLQNKGYHFYTHTPKEILPYTLVIDKLSNEFSSESIKDFLLNEMNFARTN